MHKQSQAQVSCVEEAVAPPLQLLAQGICSLLLRGTPVCLISFLTLEEVWPTLIHDLINQIEIWSRAHGAHLGEPKNNTIQGHQHCKAMLFVAS